ncbi:hypothetical protein UPYG_G00173670 [Umbra pygmaea]|uniref:Gypsy retrotransposon integrase-like protein 1 n=1 Tax=Umbra pygmaea TaxID=75934 RepID=A0ABD0WP90_UMBPY
MDPKIVGEVLDVKQHNQDSKGFNKEKYVIKRRADTVSLKDGDLYYICSQFGGHCEVEKTHSATISHYYCPGMEEDIRKWVNYGLCQRLGMKRSLCSPYHPQMNGLVEKLNGTIQRSLNKVVADHPKDCDQYLQSTVFVLWKKKQLTTKYSPYIVMFERDARYPSVICGRSQTTK